MWELPIARATVVERLMRRFAAAGTRQDLTRCARLLALAPGPDHIKRLMAGSRRPMPGRSLVGLPPELTDALRRHSGQSVTLGLRQGKPEALAEALRLLADERGDRARQIQLLQVLGEVRRPACVPVVLRLACQSSDNALRTAALNCPGRLRRSRHRPRRAGGLFQHVRRRSGRRPEFARHPRRRGRPGSSRRSSLMRLILAPYLARSSRDFCSWATHEIADRVTRDLRLDQARQLGRAESRDRPAGRRGPRRLGGPQAGQADLRPAVCRCHILFGKGGKVGPDLTTYRRDDLETMLLNIVNPSAEIREGYTTLIVATTDGRVLTGMVVEEDKNVVVLRCGDGKEVTAGPLRDRRHKTSRNSIMPEGLLKELERPADPRPVRLSPEHATTDRLNHRRVTITMRDRRPCNEPRQRPRPAGDRSGSRRSRSRATVAVTADPRWTSRSDFARMIGLEVVEVEASAGHDGDLIAGAVDEFGQSFDPFQGRRPAARGRARGPLPARSACRGLPGVGVWSNAL